MQLKPRLLAAAFGLALAPLAASAQDIPLVTEAPVEFEITFSTSVTKETGEGVARVDDTKAYRSIIRAVDIIKSFIADGTIDETPPIDANSHLGWSLVAVRSAPADLYEVDTEFFLYAIKTVNGTVTRRVLIPGTIFQIAANFSTENATTVHSTRNIESSNGNVVNHADLQFTPTFVRKEVPPTVTGPFEQGTNRHNLSVKEEAAFTLSSLLSSGFSTITFRTIADPVFFFATSSIRFTSSGDFSGNLVTTTITTKDFTDRTKTDEVLSSVPGPSIPASGLVSLRVSVLAAKLVDGSLYPDVAY